MTELVSTDTVIEMLDVAFSYDRTPALHDVNLTICKHDFAHVVGPNGGGKTTLIKLMLGLLKPSSGSVRVLGRNPEEVRSLIGYMPQNALFDPQFPATVMDVVLMGRLGRSRRPGPYRKADRECALRALTDVTLLDLKDKPLSKLSGGQQRRALIARALASEPQLLLLDEPTANLDLLVEQELYELLRTLNEKLTIVVVSHDLAFVSQFVKNVICVNRHVAMHPTAEVDEAMVSELYGVTMRMVRHDRHLDGEQHR